MVRPEKANWLDEVIARTAPGLAPEPDFDAWRRRHAHALEALAQRAQRTTRHGGPLPSVMAFGRKLMRPSPAKLAVAAAILIVVLAGIHFLGGTVDGTGKAFAAIARNVNQSSTLQFAVRSGQLTGRVYEKDGYLVRAEIQSPEPWPFDTMLTNRRTDERLYLDSKRKIAFHPDGAFRSTPSSIYELFTNHRDTPGYSVKTLGEKRIDNQLVIGFRLTTYVPDMGPLQYEIWADPETKLPIRIETTVTNAQGESVEQTITEIEFDRPLDDALFDFTPEGYEIVAPADVSPPSGEPAPVTEPAPAEPVQEATPTTEPDEIGHIGPANVSLRDSPHTEGLGTVAGTVLDRSTDAPIPGAEVSFSTHEIAITDVKGQFDLVYTKPDYEAPVYVVAPGYAVERFMAPVAQRDARDITVELARGSTIAGRVTDQAGRPVRGAELSSICLPPQRRTAVTDADGRFEIDGFDPVVHGYAITIAHPDFPLTSATVPPAPAGQTRYQDIVLQAGATILGQVTDGDGNPLEGVTVGNTGSRAMWNCITARTSAEGQYQLENVPVGELTLWAVDSNHGLHVQRTVIEPDTTVRQMDIRLQEPVPLRGRVIDETGTPVAGVQVIVHAYNGVSNLTDERYTSDTDGRFVIPNAPPEGSITLACLREGICSEEYRLELGLDEYVLTVHRAGRVYGMVLAETTGEPIPEFTVKMSASGVGSDVTGFRAPWLDQGYVFESPEGLFDTGIDRLPLGSMVRMTVQAPGHDSLTLDPVPIQPVSTDPHRTVFRLQPATVFAGRVVSREGHPIEGATVLLFSDQSEPEREYWPRAETDAMGTYVLSELEPEPYCLFVSAPGFTPRVHVMADLLEPANQLTDVVLDVAVTVTGHAIDENGEGIAGLCVTASVSLGRAADVLTRLPSLRPRTQTDNDGHYRLSEVPTGPVTISLSDSDGYELERHQVTLESGESKEIDFGGEDGCGVSGIVRIGGVPIENARISLRLEPARQFQRRTDRQGRFHIHGVTEGTYSLWVVWQPGFVEKPTSWPKEQLFQLRQTVHVDHHTELDVDLETDGAENQ